MIDSINYNTGTHDVLWSLYDFFLYLNKYNSKCGIIYVFKLMLETITHIKVFHRMQYIRLLLFYSVIVQSVIFQSCKFHPPPVFLMVRQSTR